MSEGGGGGGNAFNTAAAASHLSMPSFRKHLQLFNAEAETKYGQQSTHLNATKLEGLDHHHLLISWISELKHSLLVIMETT